MRHATSKLLSDSVLQEQIDLETQAVRAGVSRYRRLVHEAIERGEGASLKPAERMLLHWFGPMVAAVRQELRAIRRGQQTVGRQTYGPVMLQLDAQRLAVVTIHQMLSQCMLKPGGVRVPKLAHAIGRDVLAEINLDRLKSDAPDRLEELDRIIRRRTPTRLNWWAKRTLTDPLWSRKVCMHTGVQLMWLLIGVASADDYDKPFVLAFHHRSRKINRKTQKFIALDNRAFELIEDGHAVRQYLRPRYLPMLVPPYPWTKDAQGGYVRIRTPYISKPTPSQKKALEHADLSRVNECLSAVNSTAWRINRPVMEVMRRLWESGGGIASIPRRDNLPLPPKPPRFDDDSEVRRKWRKEAAPIYRRNALSVGERATFVGKLDTAHQLADRPRIYFPHQMDFRGRCYPIPVHLNHQGDDVCRGLLEFADPVSPGDRGLWWLKVHAANCFGVDKVSYEQRVAWTEANGKMIRTIAADPIGTVDLWSRADKGNNAWQFLAACRALNDPEAAKHLPVQLDGTCNGLQHYAALGRDAAGGASVNLIPSAQPSDVYALVAAATARIVEADARGEDGRNMKFTVRNGEDKTTITVPVRELAATVGNLVTRSVVKHTVMTSVYGVTRFGASDQVATALKEAGLQHDAVRRIAAYLAGVVLNGVGQVCVSATRIMSWLRSCALAIASGAGHPVAWTTPLGLPVLQPYRRYYSVRIQTVMQRVNTLVPDESVPVAIGKQRDGFAPNFIHSLDATHMLTTARDCAAAGIPFAAVHDSFWTHAATVDRMGKVLRQAFVSLHSRPILTELRNELAMRYPDVELPLPPEPGDLDIQHALESPYLFS